MNCFTEECGVILITTSDYYPQIGGLTSFTSNIVKVLDELSYSYDIFHWKNFHEIQNYDESNFNKYDLIINIHPMFCWMKNSGQEKMINFIHGSEILMTSPNLIKRIIKKINKNNFYKKLELAKFNFFISAFTKNKIESLGYKLNYSRDIVFHNCIDVSKASKKNVFEKKDLNLICVARNVPHKNIDGAVKLAELLASLTGKRVKLTLSPGVKKVSQYIEITNLADFTDETRSKAYEESDFNLLLSLDHSASGFFEGYGLTILEAAIYGTPSIVLDSGGLPEAVHHLINGYVINEISIDALKPMLPILEINQYKKMSEAAYEHATANHSLYFYEKLIKRIVENIK